MSTLIGKTKPMLNVFEKIERAAAVDCPVLICGESGTGRLLVAQTIHRRSRRADKPFVPVPAEAIFERAKTRRFPCALNQTVEICGCFEAAHGGTILIDEITRVPNVCQAVLLGELEKRETPLSTCCKAPNDFRLMAKTCMRPFECIDQGILREDLYYQLAIVTIKLPPLRERKEDIPLLVHHFLNELCKTQGRPVPTVTDELMEQLVDSPWLGNVRQLRDCVAGMLQVDGADVLGPAHFEAASYNVI